MSSAVVTVTSNDIYSPELAFKSPITPRIPRSLGTERVYPWHICNMMSQRRSRPPYTQGLLFESIFDNGGNGAIKVPGFLHIPVDVELVAHKRFAHGAHDWVQERLTAREIAMLRYMNAITDRPDWHQEVFFEAVLAQWHEEARNVPLISESAWQWCIAELRDKATSYRDTRMVAVFDTESSICKADWLVPESLLHELRYAMEPLLDNSAEIYDWEPGSNRQVLNLVDPNLFPHIAGRTRVLSRGGQIAINELALAYLGQGTEHDFDGHINRSEEHRLRSCADARPFRWSKRFQMLPCEVEFTGPVGSTKVRLTSYINNLRPDHNRDLHSALERIASLAIQTWNDILVARDQGCKPPRIRTYGVEYEPEYPSWEADLPNDPHDEGYAQARYLADRYLAQPDHTPGHPPVSAYWDNGYSLSAAVRDKYYTRLRHLVHPEPGVSYTYHDWKVGKAGQPIIPGIEGLEDETTGSTIPPRPHHVFPVTKLQETFRERGLQIIVKLTSIELSAEKPSFAGEPDFRIAGMLNEHIVATALLQVESMNITTPRIAFRTEAELPLDELNYPSMEFPDLLQVFGITKTDGRVLNPGERAPALQNLGAVETAVGRMVTWPNTLQSKLEGFELLDVTRQGCSRFLTLWLVDPHYRIVSTRNVPPQQHHWWAEMGLNRIWDWVGAPTDIADEIEGHVGEETMGMNEAKRLRDEMLEERASGMQAVNKGVGEYDFEEHWLLV